MEKTCQNMYLMISEMILVENVCREKVLFMEKLIKWLVLAICKLLKILEFSKNIFVMFWIILLLLKSIKLRILFYLHSYTLSIVIKVWR